MKGVPKSKIKAYRSVELLLWTTAALVVFCPGGRTAQPAVALEESTRSLPYARIAERPPRYEGPGRAPEEDIRSEVNKIGLLVPLEGSSAEAGRALQLAAELAIEETHVQHEYRYGSFRLETRSASGAWGKASRELVRLIYADQVVGLVAPLEGASAHLVEQVANKAGVPVLSLAPDSTTTEINLPWIFRCLPSDKQQAEILAREIYVQRGVAKVALVSQDNRDGRLGASAFRAAARNPHRLMTLQLAPEPLAVDFDLLLSQLRQAPIEALVLWTEPAQAARIVGRLRQSGLSMEIYLSMRAAQPPFFTLSGKFAEGVHVVAPTAGAASAEGSESFAAQYKSRAGSAPTPTAAATFECVRLLVRAIKVVGPNRARLRDYLATGPPYFGATGEIAFDPEGNLKDAWTVSTYQAEEDESCPGTKSSPLPVK